MSIFFLSEQRSRIDKMEKSRAINSQSTVGIAKPGRITIFLRTRESLSDIAIYERNILCLKIHSRNSLKEKWSVDLSDSQRRSMTKLLHESNIGREL